MYKLCILAAGKGTRNTAIRGLHKSLLPLSSRASISKILEKFPNNVPVVIATGYKSSQIENYCKIVHADRDIQFVRVKNFEGPGSGPGQSLLECREALQCPFVFTSADTILDEDTDFFKADENWVAVSLVDSSESKNYSLVDLSCSGFKFFFGEGKSSYAFTGIAGINSFKDFWDSLSRSTVINGEIQVLQGLSGLNSVNKRIVKSWVDTGSNVSYEKAKKVFPNTVVIEKNDESIFIDNGWVIKYFLDEDKAKNRVARSLLLRDAVPEVVNMNNNMFAYRFVEGKRLSDISNEIVFEKFLDDYFERFISSFSSNKNIEEDCYEMYVNKTIKRIQKFSKSRLDAIETIDGIRVKDIETTLGMIDWKSVINNSRLSRFHGDLQPENIIYSENLDRFFYIDWRESFGSSLEAGDLYYDLGKLYHALIISNSVVMDGGYSTTLDFENSSASLSFLCKSNLIAMDNTLRNFCDKKQLSYNHVRLVGILNYLNIACLYDNFQEGRYGDFLYLLGKKMLTQWIGENKK